MVISRNFARGVEMEKRRPRCIGLIGGLGPGATIHYYKGLIGAYTLQDAVPDLVIVHADVNRVLRLVGEGDISGLAHYLAEIIARLKDAQATVCAIPAITPHICAPLLATIARLPLISMVDVLRAGLSRRKLRRIALFGTRFTVESDVFGQLTDYDVIRPRPAEVDRVHNIYTSLVETGRGSDEQARQLQDIAHRLIDEDAVEAIVMAGTDLAVLIDVKRADYPLIDCAQLHIEEIVCRTLGSQAQM
jgi:aspartate racemase